MSGQISRLMATLALCALVIGAATPARAALVATHTIVQAGMSDAGHFTAVVDGVGATATGTLRIEGRTLSISRPLSLNRGGYAYWYNLAAARLARFRGPTAFRFCVRAACRSGVIPLPVAVLHGVLGDMAGLLGTNDPYPPLLQALRAAGYADTGQYRTLAFVVYPSFTAYASLLNPTNHAIAVRYGDGVKDFAARYLALAVRRLLAGSYAARVDLVGHSMGGLLARAYVAAPQNAARVRTLVLLGTPNQGSAATFERLGPATTLPRTASDLLPTYPFLRDAATGRFLAPPLANRYLQMLNRQPAPRGVRVVCIYAHDFATVSVLEVRGTHFTIVGHITAPGDGTVTVASAVLPGARSIAVADGVQHQALPRDPHIQLIILAVLRA